MTLQKDDLLAFQAVSWQDRFSRPYGSAYLGSFYCWLRPPAQGFAFVRAVR